MRKLQEIVITAEFQALTGGGFMKNIFDIRTLALFGGITGLLVAGIMIHVSLRRRTYPGFYHWTIAYVLGGGGLVLMGLRHTAPDLVSIVLANLLVIAQPFFLARGMAIFVQAREHTRVEIFIMLALLVLISWFTYLQPSVTNRIVLFNLAFAFFTIRLAFLTAWGLPRLPQMGSNWLLVGLFVIFSVWYLLRTFLTLQFESPTTDLMSSSWLQSVTFSFSILANIGISMLLITLTAQRIEADLCLVHNELNQKNLQLENANKQLERISLQDGLTGLSNRRSFDQILEKEWQRMLRNKSPLSLIMIDIDFFKEFNDNDGHLAGDDCIRSVARALEQCIGRASDVAARYGGDEFALILPESSSSGAHIVAQAIQSSLQKMTIAHQASEVGELVTLSFGVATMIPHDSSSPKFLLDLADKALYTSKENGRNLITALDH